MSIGKIAVTPQVSALSPLNDPKLTVEGRLDTTGFTSKDFSTLFKAQNGAYDQFAMLPLDQQVQVLQVAQKEKIKDVGDILISPIISEAKDNGTYDMVKAQTRGATSKELLSAAVDPTVPLPQDVKAALYARGIAVRNAGNKFKTIVKSFVESSQETPAAKKAREDREKQDKQTARTLAGLDGEAEGGGESTEVSTA